MPDALWKKRRRETPCLEAMESAMSISRASTSFCCGVCGDGRYSSLETTCVGTGEGNAVSSAPCKSFNSSSFRKCICGPPEVGRYDTTRSGDLAARGHSRGCKNAARTSAHIAELRDLLHAENQLVKALPKMAKAAKNGELKTAFQDHLGQTKGHVERLTQAST